MTAMLKLQPDDLTFGKIFQRNYPLILKWAEQITGSDRDFSKDLLHETYLKLQNHSPAEVKENLSSYLYASMCNSYHSHLRKQLPEKYVPLSEVGLSDSPLFSIDPLDALNVYEQIEEICRYACLRKESSLSGILIILKFFHGYNTDEIQMITQRSRNALEALLAAARQGISRYLDAGKRGFLHDFNKTVPEKRSGQYDPFRADFQSGFKEQIFSSCCGECLTTNEFREIYLERRMQVERSLISHIVSCEKCLDKINTLLNLPLLTVRHPLNVKHQ